MSISKYIKPLLYLFITNEIPFIDGAWNTNNALTGGWSILGNITIENSSLSIIHTTLDENLEIYPNPANNKLNIKYNNVSLKSIKIYDTAGRFLKNITDENEITSDVKTFDISNLSSGTYFLTIVTKDGITSQNRFIKN